MDSIEAVFILVIAIPSLIMILTINLSLTIKIAKAEVGTKRARRYAYWVIWLVPFLGVFLVPPKLLPGFYSLSSIRGGSGVSDGSGGYGGESSGCGGDGGGCGD